MKFVANLIIDFVLFDKTNVEIAFHMRSISCQFDGWSMHAKDENHGKNKCHKHISTLFATPALIVGAVDIYAGTQFLSVFRRSISRILKFYENHGEKKKVCGYLCPPPPLFWWVIREKKNQMKKKRRKKTFFFSAITEVCFIIVWS